MSEQRPKNYTARIQPEAQAEIIEAYQWYEDKAEGLGTEFVRAVDACLAAVERNPTIYALVHKQVRRALLRRFPYGIFYLVEGEAIVILACFHGSRDPEQWQQRA